ncbi:MAG: GNAT family N-acetyltransferase [Vulcanimicrobiaceae bacterium]
MPDAQLRRAGDDEIAAFGRRRFRDSTGRTLYGAMAGTAACGAWVATDEGEPVGIAFAHACGDSLTLSELFVHPSQRNAGIGRALLARATEDCTEFGRRGLIAAGDSAASGFAARCGLGSLDAVLRVAGAIPRENDLLAMASASGVRFEVAELDPVVHAPELDALDGETIGTARAGDHADFKRYGGIGNVFFLHGECVGYAYVWPDGRIGPMAAASAGYQVALLAFSLVALVQRFGASWCTALVSGANVRVLELALRAGLRVEESLTFVADRRDDGDRTRYVGFHDLLF